MDRLKDLEEEEEEQEEEKASPLPEMKHHTLAQGNIDGSDLKTVSNPQHE